MSDDKRLNNTNIQKVAPVGHHVYTGGNKELKYVPTLFKDIKVGDLIQIKDGEQFPADCILIKI